MGVDDDDNDDVEDRTEERERGGSSGRTHGLTDCIEGTVQTHLTTDSRVQSSRAVDATRTADEGEQSEAEESGLVFL